MFKKGNFMKKILILFITIITLTGCDSTPRKEFRVRLENDIITNMDKYHFNYNGHQYIMFTPYTALRDNTVVHDPDCPCLKK
jgi:hypothetical protein